MPKEIRSFLKKDKKLGKNPDFYESQFRAVMKGDKLVCCILYSKNGKECIIRYLWQNARESVKFKQKHGEYPLRKFLKEIVGQGVEIFRTLLLKKGSKLLINSLIKKEVIEHIDKKNRIKKFRPKLVPFINIVHLFSDRYKRIEYRFRVKPKKARQRMPVK